MLPALSPTQTFSPSVGRRSASPDCPIQWQGIGHRRRSASRTSAAWTRGTQRFVEAWQRGQLEHAQDFQPSRSWGTALVSTDEPLRLLAGVAQGWPYTAVGMQSALDSSDRLSQ